MKSNKLSNSENLSQKIIVRIIAIAVLINGLLLILATLGSQLIRRIDFHINLFNVQANLIIGLTLIYLANLLLRRKQTAWIVVLIVYGFYFGISLGQYTNLPHHHYHHFLYESLAKSLIFPTVVILGLLYSRKSFNVKSDIKSFGFSLRIALIVLVVTFCYGVAGFSLMDHSDFHQNIGITEAAHRTVDQFNFTTSGQLVAYTKRARVFLDSLNVISVVALGYILLSLFQPLRARLGDESSNRRRAIAILNNHHSSSEGFFKIWPYDKTYFFNTKHTAFIAYAVHRGVALVAGDPVGAIGELKKLIRDFNNMCHLNDWQPSFIHTEPHYNELYKKQGFTVQKIGQEAKVDVDNFINNVVTNKYFRNVNNKFAKGGYKVELLKPPHSKELISELKKISDDWLQLPGRQERGFMMGYFSEQYLDMCRIMVLRNSDNKIVAFINQITSYDSDEANYDMIRHYRDAPGNSVDFLLLNFIKCAKSDNMKRVNLGLCPLVGLNKNEKDRSIIDSALQFVYANGDRLYSFSGLHRFKQKYDPTWLDRYVVYKGGLRGFTKSFRALNVAMKPHKQHRLLLEIKRELTFSDKKRQFP